MSTIRVAKLNDEAILPTRKNPTDAGMDLYAFVDDYHRFVDVLPHEMNILYTGITVEIPKGHVGLIYPKSRNIYLIGAGVVDEGYQGEILVKIVNTNTHTVRFSHGDAIAQMVIVPVFTPEIVETPLDEIHKVETFRGKSGGITEQIVEFKSNVEITTFSDPDRTFLIEKWD
jgi:dUTP pyrophosphatase